MHNNTRVRTVAGSCSSCRKRRVKCDLARPECQRCAKVGAACDYNDSPIRWSARPACAALAKFQSIPSPSDSSSSSSFGNFNLNLASREERALGYFKGRFWPLLTTASRPPCDPPIPLALDSKVLLLAICLAADTHRVLQDGRNSRTVPQIKRLECLSAVRGELRQASEAGKPPMREPLFAVLLLYFNAGYLECIDSSGPACTASHHSGVVAIAARLGGVEVVLDTGPPALQMLVSEFASSDLTMAMLTGARPCFAPEAWDKIDQGSVWWTRDPLDRVSLASVLAQMSSMAHYRASIVEDGGSNADVCAETIAEFQAALAPVFAPLDLALAASPDAVEAAYAYSLIRAFQHAALIYLYRAVCGLPENHVLVQQHVLPCLDCILFIEHGSKVLNCVIFPLLVAGAHARSTIHRRGVINLLNLIHSEVKFASVQSVSNVLEGLWRSDALDRPWNDLFLGLGPDAAIL